MDIGELRQRIGREMDTARRAASERRRLVDAAQEAYTTFVQTIAAPLVRQVVTVLRADGVKCSAFTPADSVRLAFDRNAADYIEIVLDADANPPHVLGRASLARGQRGVVVDEEPIRPDKPVSEITEEDVVTFLLPALRGYFSSR